MSILQRNYHWTDLEVAINPDRTRRRQRRIKNWINFRRPDSNDINKLLSFEETDNNEQPTQQSAPDHWMGNYDFKYQLLNQPLQVFLGDSTTPRNTALWGMRRANNPNAWVNFKAVGVNNDVAMEVFGSQKAVRWQSLWTNSTLWLQASANKVIKQIRLSAPGHPVSFKFVMRIPDGYSYEIANDTILIKDENGTTQLRARPPYGWDSSTVALSDDGAQNIRVTLTETTPVTVGNKSFPAFLITPNADDLASAVYPVFIDPDTTIGGGSVWDAYGRNDQNQINFGGRDRLQAGTQISLGRQHNAFLKIETSDLPEIANVVNTFRYDGYRYNARAGAVDDANPIYVNRILIDWVEGTATASSQAGSVCWLSAKLGSVNWTGGGCTSAGNDYATSVVQDEFYTLATYDDKELVQIPLTGDGLNWPKGWKDGDYNNYGMVWRKPYVAANEGQNLCTSEHAESQYYPSYFIEYDESASNAIFFGSNF
jgi:hypothetical protein